jgi:hypothetical protein
MSKHSDYTNTVPANDVKRDERQGDLFAEKFNTRTRN